MHSSILKITLRKYSNGVRFLLRNVQPKDATKIRRNISLKKKRRTYADAPRLKRFRNALFIACLRYEIPA